ncbi:hypothetical protein D3C75_1290660 [compost metagenome]
MFKLLRFNARAVVFNLEPGAVKLAATADFNPAISITRGIHHHIGDSSFNGQRMDIHQ